jgi:hypothetical protein
MLGWKIDSPFGKHRHQFPILVGLVIERRNMSQIEGVAESCRLGHLAQSELRAAGSYPAYEIRFHVPCLGNKDQGGFYCWTETWKESRLISEDARVVCAVTADNRLKSDQQLLARMQVWQDVCEFGSCENCPPRKLAMKRRGVVLPTVDGKKPWVKKLT